jgi:type II secretory pathway component PulF
MSTSSEGSEDYLARIDAAVAHSQPLQDWLEWRSSQDSKVPSKQTRLLLHSLKGSVESSQWLNDPKLAAMLPMVLRAADSPHDLSQLEPWYQLLLVRPTGLIDFVRKFYYPLSVALAAVLVLYFLAVSVIPTFKQMFMEFELRLPPLTILVLKVSDFISNYPIGLIATVLIGIGSLVGMVKFFFYMLDRWEGNDLILALRRGTKQSLGSMARWTGTLSELLRIGTPVGRAILVAGLASQRPWLNDQSQQLASAHKIFPEKPWPVLPGANSFSASSIQALEMDRQGEPGAPILRELAQSYAVRYSGRPSFYLNWLSPILLVFVGFLVFLIVVALFSPLISLISSLSG